MADSDGQLRALTFKYQRRYGLAAAVAVMVVTAVFFWEPGPVRHQFLGSPSTLAHTDGTKPADVNGDQSVDNDAQPKGEQGATPPEMPPADDPFADQRRRMVERQLRDRGISDKRVLQAMQRVPRHMFVPPDLRSSAYADHPLPIGQGQTISQPYIVALMTQEARTRPDSKALDIGTGSGYQAAILAQLCKEVYSIEILPKLAEQARGRLKSYANVHVRCGDGYRGWREHAPFDVIILAAAPDHVPEPLVEQLAPNGRLVLPVGRYFQSLLVIEKQADGSTRRRNIAAVAFVPMTGEAEKPKDKP